MSLAEGDLVGDGNRIDAAVAPPGLVNIANALTILRLAMVPVFVLLLLAEGPRWRVAAFVVFGVASITDLLDGEIARRRSLITDFGKITDPIADKALTGSALVTLSVLGELPWWVTGVIAFRELAVTGLRFWVIRQGVIAASRGGKIKTLLQIIAISLFILPGRVTVIADGVMAAAVLVTVITGCDYVVRALRLHRAVPHGPVPSGAGPGRPGSAPPEVEGNDAADPAPVPEAAGAEAAGAEAAGAEAAGAEAAGAEAAGAEAAGAGAAGAAAAGAEAREADEAR